MSGEQFEEAGRLAGEYGDGVRLATDQNLIFTGVPEDRLDELLAEPFWRGTPRSLGRSSAASWLCGERVLPLRHRRDQGQGRRVGPRDGREGRRPGQEAVRMHFSGCSASCAQPQIGDIGFRGETAKTRDAIVEGVDIGLGGSLGKDAAFIDWVEGAKPAGEVPDALVAVFEQFEEERREGERFHEWARRKKNAELREALRKPVESELVIVAGFDIREMMNDIDEAPGKVWFWDLEKAVIDADRCVQCGVCVAACPTDSIGIGEDDLPQLVKMCTGCSLCWDFCPRGGLQYESTWKITGGSNGKSIEGMGRVEESYTARVRQRIDGVQDGGFVSALLISLLEAGEIDGALLARESATERWKGEAFWRRRPRRCARARGASTTRRSRWGTSTSMATTCRRTPG